MSDPSNIPIVNPNSNPTEPSKNIPADPEKFKKLLKVDESDEAQKRHKRNLKKEDEDEEKVKEGSAPRAGLFEGLLKKKEKKDSIFDVKQPTTLKSKKSTETAPEELLEIEKPKSKILSKSQAEEKQKKIDQVSDTDSGQFFFNESSTKRGKNASTEMKEETPTLSQKPKEQLQAPLELGKEPIAKIEETEATESTISEESTKLAEEPAGTVSLEEKQISASEVKQIQPVEETVRAIAEEEKLPFEQPNIEDTQLTAETLPTEEIANFTSSQAQSSSKKEFSETFQLEKAASSATEKQLETKTQETAQIKQDFTISREEKTERTKEEQKTADISAKQTEKKISSKQEDKITTQATFTQQEHKEIETYKKVDHAEEAAKTTDAPPFLIQTYLDTMIVEPVQEIPPYSKLTPEVFDIFQKMIGMISIVKEQGVDRTTVTINLPGSIFDKGNLIIERYASAANSFNVQFEGDENAVNLFNDHSDDLVAALGHAKLNYSVNVKRAVLASSDKKE